MLQLYLTDVFLTIQTRSARITLRLNELIARVAELADAQDLKSCELRSSYRFDSGLGHHRFCLCIPGFSTLMPQEFFVFGQV